MDSSQCLAHLTPARVGIARSVHVQLPFIGGINTCNKMRPSLSLPTVTYIRMETERGGDEKRGRRGNDERMRIGGERGRGGE